MRTRQTAELVAAAFRNPPPIVNMASLAPGRTHNAIIEELSKQHRRHHIALVGHEPGIGELAGRLIGLRRPLEFKKGAICRIDVAALPPAGPGQLRWFLTPRIIRKIASKIRQVPGSARRWKTLGVRGEHGRYTTCRAQSVRPSAR